MSNEVQDKKVNPEAQVTNELLLAKIKNMEEEILKLKAEVKDFETENQGLKTEVKDFETEVQGLKTEN